MGISKGREKEAVQIFQANIAAAVGRLFLGEFNNWDAFFDDISIDLLSLPRKQLKSGARDVKARLSSEIKKFYKKNFENFSYWKAHLLCKEIAKNRGFEIPLKKFEEEYFLVKPEVLKGTPRHATLVISLWGLKFQFPEDELTKDIAQSLELSESATEKLNSLRNLNFENVKNKKAEVADLFKTKNFACRSCILACFNLIEAYLNGIAWEYVGQNPALDGLSQKEQKLICDSSQASFREKIIKYPEIITGKSLWDNNHPLVKKLLGTIKPFRDSLVHPSPFIVPEKFGGYDKLKIIYRLDTRDTEDTVKTTFKIILKIHNHLFGPSDIPEWLSPLRSV